MQKRIILGLQVTKQIVSPLEVQKILNEYSRSIKTRLGLHEPEDSQKNTLGLLLMECCGIPETIREMESKLKKIPGVVVKKMVFEE